MIDSSDFFRYDSSLCADAHRSEVGTLYDTGLAGFHASVETLLEIGIPEIEQRIRHLTDHLIVGLRGRDYEIISPIENWEDRSGTVSFGPKSLCSEAPHRRLIEAEVIVALRGKGTGVSPHFYSTEEEIDCPLAVLDQA